MKKRPQKEPSFALWFFISVSLFFISKNLLDAYTSGDQVAYHAFYNFIQGVPLSEVGPIALSLLNSAEPVSWLVLWVGSNIGIDKSIFISGLNVLLITGMLLLLRKHGSPWWVAILLVTNFYVLVLLTSAERLKISYILLILAFILYGNWRVFLAALSPLAHLQSFILLTAIFFATFGERLAIQALKGRFSKRTLYYSGLVTIIGLLLVSYTRHGVLHKAEGYLSQGVRLHEMLNVSILLLCGWIVTNNRIRMTLAFLPLVVGVAFLGGQRMNMVAVSMTLGLLLIERRLKHPLIIALLLYFSVKSIPFLYNIYTYGDGFTGTLW